MERIENLQLLLCHCRYILYRNVTVVILYQSEEIYANGTIRVVAMATKCLEIEKKILKNHLWNFVDNKVQTLSYRKDLSTSLYKITVFHGNCSSSLPYLFGYKTGLSLSRMSTNNQISPMQFCCNTGFTLPKQSQSSRSVL